MDDARSGSSDLIELLSSCGDLRKPFWRSAPLRTNRCEQEVTTGCKSTGAAELIGLSSLLQAPTMEAAAAAAPMTGDEVTPPQERVEAERVVANPPSTSNGNDTALLAVLAISTDEETVSSPPSADITPPTPSPPRAAKPKSFQRGSTATSATSSPKSAVGIDGDDDGLASDDEEVVSRAREEFELKADDVVMTSLKHLSERRKEWSDVTTPVGASTPKLTAADAAATTSPASTDPINAQAIATSEKSDGGNESATFVDREMISSLDLSPSEWPRALVDNFDNKDTYPDISSSSDEEALQWVVGERRLLARVVTWNLCARPPPSDMAALDCLFAPGKFHLYVIGTVRVNAYISTPYCSPAPALP